MKVHISPITAGDPHDIFELLVQAVEEAAEDSCLKVAVAYVTLGGVERLAGQLDAVPNWAELRKRILVGIHHAITEPSAIEALRGLPQAEVRAFVPGGRLTMRAFETRPVFHPKTIAISHARGLCFLQAGSANMTAAAIGERPGNYEFSLSLLAEGNQPLDRAGAFEDWFARAWDQSRRADRRFIRDYARLRRQVQDANPILRVTSEVPASIAEAKYFFAEVGAGSGPPGRRHQIEFPESLARFFGRPSRDRRQFTLRRGHEVWEGRPLSHKRTTYGVDIWRLGMPTQTTGGPPIAERAIRFERTVDPGTFEFDVVDTGDDEFSAWIQTANLNGHLGATHGLRSRRYGFYGL